MNRSHLLVGAAAAAVGLCAAALTAAPASAATNVRVCSSISSATNIIAYGSDATYNVLPGVCRSIRNDDGARVYMAGRSYQVKVKSGGSYGAYSSCRAGQVLYNPQDYVTELTAISYRYAGCTNRPTAAVTA